MTHQYSPLQEDIESCLPQDKLPNNKISPSHSQDEVENSHARRHTLFVVLLVIFLASAPFMVRKRSMMQLDTFPDVITVKPGSELWVAGEKVYPQSGDSAAVTFVNGQRVGAGGDPCPKVFTSHTVVDGRPHTDIRLDGQVVNPTPSLVVIPSSSSIPYKPGQLSYTFDFLEQGDSNNFEFLQHLNYDQPDHSGQSIQIRGGVTVKAAPSDAHMVTVDLDIDLSHDVLAESIHISKETPHKLNVETDAILPRHRGATPWIKIVAIISVHPSILGPQFGISTIQLPVTLEHSLRLEADKLDIKTVSGNVVCSANNLDSRHISVETTSGSIFGTYPLADLLSLKSVSGTVTVNAEPKDGDSNNLDGKFVVETRSGSVHVDTSASRIPDRRYSTSVISNSGTVSGSYLLGYNTKINSGSGSLRADLYVAGSVADRTLDLRTQSGTINSEIIDNSYKLDKLSTEVHSISGTIDAKFPQSWSGDFSLESMSGSLRATGRDVRITYRSSMFPNSLKGSRGDGRSYLLAKTMSGSVHADFA